MATTIEASSDAILAFGMVESGEMRVKTRSLVYDPQRPRELGGIDLTWADRERLAIVLNRTEAAAITDGKVPDLAAAEIASRWQADVVVVKRAAQGALVFSEGRFHDIGVYETDRVFPIGSGDVFAAAFAWSWGLKEMEPARAANVASLAAATWCSTKTLPLPLSVANLSTELRELTPKPVQVYLAGPFFSLAEQWLVETCRNTLTAMGATVFSPLHDVGRTGHEIAQKDLAGLQGCDSVLALLDGADTGTWFELGWARKAGIPAVAYCNPANSPQMKMAEGTDVEVTDDLSTAVYRAIWAGQH
jgi:hypothetical protein